MYNRTTHFALYFLLAGALCLSNSCSGNTTSVKSDSAAIKKHDSLKNDQPLKQEMANDEQQFRAFFKDFKDAVKQKNKKQLAAMISFPLQTLPQWTNDDLKSTSVNPVEGLVSEGEYPQYEKVLFTNDATRLIPKSTEDDLSEIDKDTPENYYKTIAKITDKGSTLYELQQQYEQSNGKETSYGFVFGKVKGHYKIISYFCPWPLKG